MASHWYWGATGGRERISFALLTCFAAAVPACCIAAAAFFSLLIEAVVNPAIAARTDWISDAHLLFDADNRALSELSCRISAAERQSLTANPPVKATAASTAMIIAVIAGLIICRNRWLEMGRGSKKRPVYPRVVRAHGHACPRGRRLSYLCARNKKTRSRRVLAVSVIPLIYYCLLSKPEREVS